jgi:serine/threonine protein kinase
MYAPPTVGVKVTKCLMLIMFSEPVLDLIKKELIHGGSGFAFVVDDPDLHLEFVLKLIMLGSKESASRAKNQKMIQKEMSVGMVVAKECSHLVSYSEIFEWSDYFCIKMEYCELGDLQNQLDQNRVFTEEVNLSFSILINN